MNPRKTSVRAGEIVELGLLAYPENAQRQKAHHVHEQTRREQNQGVAQITLVVYGFSRRNSKIEYEQGHSDREHTITQRSKPLCALSRNLIVGYSHSICPSS